MNSEYFFSVSLIWRSHIQKPVKASCTMFYHYFQSYHVCCSRHSITSGCMNVCVLKRKGRGTWSQQGRINLVWSICSSNNSNINSLMQAYSQEKVIIQVNDQILMTKFLEFRNRRVFTIPALLSFSTHHRCLKILLTI